jgi:uncharacterized membrane protein YjjP (DUF1212 family)
MAYKIGAVQFSDGDLYRPQVFNISRVDGMTAEEIAFTQLNNTAIADSIAGLLATFTGKILATPPTGFAALTVDDFEVYLNGRRVPASQVTSVVQASIGTAIEVTIDVPAFLNQAGTALQQDDEIVLVGKFN